MVLIETVTALLSSGTAVSVAKFMFEKVMDYIKDKPEQETSQDILELKDEIEILKNQLETKDREDISDEEVHLIREKVEKIEQGKVVLPKELVSAAEFKKWSEQEDLDIEDQANILVRQMELLLDKSSELGLKDQKKFQLNQLTATIQTNLGTFREARFTAQLSGLSADKQEQTRLDTLVRKNIFQGRDFLKSVG